VFCISKPDNKCSGTIDLPPSKSISNRLVLLQFYYHNSFRVFNVSEADDSLLLSSTLDLVRQYHQRQDHALLRIDARNAGSVIRFLVPLLCVTPGHFFLTGNDRMKQRPIGALVEAMRSTGADIEFIEKIGFPPLLIRGRALAGDRIALDASLSSQFVTALLLLGPTLSNGLTVEMTTKPVSGPFIRMTINLLESLGVQVVSQENSIRVFAKKEITKDVTIESDWSGASFWYCMLALAEKGEVKLRGLMKSGLQGDEQVAAFFKPLGIDTIEEKTGIRIIKSGRIEGDFFADFNDYPDLALPVILACGAQGIEGTFTGLERLRLKESDRLEALAAGLLKAGITLKEEFPGTWHLNGRLINPCELVIRDYNDHRVAMTFAALAVRGFSIKMENPDVVNKSYPGFWKDLEKAGFHFNTSC
jgi:3-phosphoshikimate 1-carboxyvinyltransferase